ncbi:MAG: hypothetical protein J6I40_06835 [Mailhella sp.]|nr:hypothetical protein [Mailhella sp.]
MLIPGENGHSPLPWDLPLWQPDYAIFFGALYSVLLVLGIGIALAFVRAAKDANSCEHREH